MICGIKKCKRESVVIYYGQEICDHHWSLHCSVDSPFNLKTRLKLKMSKQGKLINQLRLIE